MKVVIKSKTGLVIVLAVIAGTAYLWLNPSESDRLPRKYFTPPDTIIFTRDGDPYAYEHKAAAWQKYRQHLYDGCISELSQLKQPDEESELLNGIARLSQNKWNAAMFHLDQAYTLGGKHVSPTTSWLYALTLLRYGDTTKALSLLNSLAAQTGPYQEKASALLKDLQQN